MKVKFAPRILRFNTRSVCLASLATIILSGGIVSASALQQKPADPAAKPSVAKPQAEKPRKNFTVRVSKAEPRLVTVKAEQASMSELAAELSSRLKVPVVLSDLVKKQKASIEFEGLTIEPAMKMLAPEVYVDYELSGDAVAQPKPLAVYLYGYNEPPPPLNATVKSNSQTLMIEGNTEDGVDAPTESAKDEKPLEIKYEKHLVSLQSKKQPLTAVLAELASTLGIPFELKYESKEIVDTSFSNFRLEDAIRRLSPNVRLYMRTDVQRTENVPLRIVLVAPSST
jgi:hypothetical protein